MNHGALLPCSPHGDHLINATKLDIYRASLNIIPVPVYNYKNKNWLWFFFLVKAVALI